MNPYLVVSMLLVVLGCASAPSRVSHHAGRGLLVPDAPEGNIVLYVTTQSLRVNPVTLTVSLDGLPIIRGKFSMGTFHPNYVEYHFDWPDGLHTVTVESDNAGTSLRSEIEVVDKQWIVLYFGYPPHEKEFSLGVFNEQPGWE